MRGHDISDRTIRSWVQYGLIDRPDKKGLGRGRGTEATWPRTQVELLMALLHHRDKGGGTPIAALCHLPVWGWLRLGDAQIPLRQVRGCLRTWASAAESPSWAEAQRGARRVVGRVAAPGVPRQRRFRLQQLLAEQVYGHHDRWELFQAAREVVDAGRPPRGPAGARLSAGSWTDLINARMSALTQLDAIPDSDFREARQVYRLTTASYATEQPRFAADPDLGDLFEQRSLEVEVNAVCVDLLAILGLLHRPERPRGPRREGR